MQQFTKRTENKEKIGTILDKNVVRLIKERSVKEGRTISDIIQEAILKYNEADSVRLEIRRKAVKSFCSRPFNLSRAELDELMQEDYYEV